MKKISKILLLFILLTMGQGVARAGVILVANDQNIVYRTLKKANIQLKRFSSVDKAFAFAREGDGILLLDHIGGEANLSFLHIKAARDKNLKVFIQYPFFYSEIRPEIQAIGLKRGVIATRAISGMDSLDILSINDHDHYTYPRTEWTLAYIAKVAGFDRAEYGIDDVPAYPFLFLKDGILISAVNISDWMVSRYGPNGSWKNIWEFILNYVGVKQDISWRSDVSVRPTYARDAEVTRNQQLEAVKSGADWYLRSKLLVAEQWQDKVDTFTKKNGEGVVFPPVGDKAAKGNGKFGILEGHASYILKDGSQPIRWWLRADCQAETAFALTTAGKVLGNNAYDSVAINLLNYLFKESNLRQGERNDPKSPSYGLIGWATTDPDAYYGDDNARVLLGAIGASVNLNMPDWEGYILEGIIGNFRTSGIHGFRGPWFRDAAMQKTTWQTLFDRDIVNVHPHYESWLWALYLWLYDKTGYEPLKERAVAAITITMNRFPQWKWTNGIQQEYARMLLPLAWLIRVDDTPRHREWLKLVSLTLLLHADQSGAIGEQLGIKGLGRYDKIRSNAEYGTKEAPLISENGDKVADLLYTMNYASFGFNEAYAATGDISYKHALDKVNDFFTKIQVHSPAHKDLHGAWFRAFDYGRWEYWASNADSGWGPWGTQTGWTQSWILQSLATGLTSENFWDRTSTLSQNQRFLDSFNRSIKIMLQ